MYGPSLSLATTLYGTAIVFVMFNNTVIRLVLKDPGSETNILGVTESWLDESIDDTRIKINGYTHERSDRSSKTIPVDKHHAGGIIV
jgi:hypothetical protein